MNRKALGKGINALIPDFEEGVPEGGKLPGTLELLIDEISPSKLQPRKYFDDEKFLELEQSVRENGILQPIIVQKGEFGFELVAGERRWRAARKAGLKKIPAIIREVTDAQSLEFALIENIHRQDLNPIEEADAYARLSNEFGLTQEKIAKRVGKNRATVTNMLRLLKLPHQVKQDIVSGRLTMGHARALIGLESAKDIDILRKDIIFRDLNVRQTEGKVNRLKKGGFGKKTSQKGPKKDIFLKNLELELERKLGTKVDIKLGKSGGTLAIKYYSDDDLERIAGLIIPEKF